ncbi:hypothetical protein V2J09_021801 [Rumex salicifolius]
MQTRSRSGGNQAHLLVYVDDIILTTSSTKFLQHVIEALSAEFSMTDMGELHYFLGISVKRTTSGLFLDQSKYAAEIVTKVGLQNCNPSRTPIDTCSKLSRDVGLVVSDPTAYRSLVGTLQYLTFTHPDISYASQQCFLHMHDPREGDLQAMKRVIRYVQGTKELGIFLQPSTTYKIFANILTKGLSSLLFMDFRSSLCIRHSETSTAGDVKYIRNYSYFLFLYFSLL